MDAPPMIWVFRAACVALAFTTAEALDIAASDWAGAARLQLALAGWALWILCTLAGWFRRAVSVAVLRCTTPMALGIVTAVVASSDWNLGLGWKVSGLACTWAVTVAAFLPQFSEWFVNGVSYGDEHRMVLRPPLPIAAVVAVVVLIGAVVDSIAFCIGFGDGIGIIKQAICFFRTDRCAYAHYGSRTWRPGERCWRIDGRKGTRKCEFGRQEVSRCVAYIVDYPAGDHADIPHAHPRIFIFGIGHFN